MTQVGGTHTIIDTHAHLDFEEFDGDRIETVARAAAAGVSDIITIGTTLAGAIKTLEIASKSENVHAAAGIHPNYVAENFGEWSELAALFERNIFVGVGETGLDFYRDHTPKSMQIAAFKEHICLSLERNLPLIIHCRDAYEEVIAAIDGFENMPRGVFHCFGGTTDFAAEAVKRGFLISFAGQLTFKKSDALRETAASIPIESILVETDCPYLAPAPNRGKRNEPAFAVHTAAMLAEVHGVSYARMAQALSANARRLFGI